MSDFLMPSLGADMDAGTLVEWLKQPGDKVAKGDIIAVVETQKGAIEIEVFEDGVLGDYLTELGKKVPVGTPLATILKPGEVKQAAPKPAPASKPKPAPKPTPKAAPAPKPAAVEVPPEPAPDTPDQARPRITPAARRAAARAGIDPASLLPGPDGIITLAEVSPGNQPAEPPAPQPMSDMRVAIAAAMSRSKREIPHYYLAQSVDITTAEDFVARINKDRPPEGRLLIGAFYLKAVAKALAKYPEMNGHFVDEQFRASDASHIGVATNIRSGGLVAPAIHDVQDLQLDALMDKLRDLVARVRAGRFRARELLDATITVTSLGDRGVDLLYGVINPPQVAIVGFGSTSERPWVHDGKIKARRVVTLTLAADHRVSDGHRGALFLNTIGKALLTPEDL